MLRKTDLANILLEDDNGSKQSIGNERRDVEGIGVDNGNLGLVDVEENSKPTRKAAGN